MQIHDGESAGERRVTNISEMGGAGTRRNAPTGGWSWRIAPERRLFGVHHREGVPAVTFTAGLFKFFSGCEEIAQSQMIEVERLKPRFVHLLHKSRIVGDDQVLAGNLREGAVGQA